MKYLLFLFLLIPTFLYAQFLTVVTENWKPYNYEENGVAKGISTVVVEKILKHAKIKYKLRVLPWARAYMMAQSKKDCLIYTIIRISPRETLFKWVRPLGKGGVTSLYRLKKNTSISFNTLEKAKIYSIVANMSSMDHLWLEFNNFPNIHMSVKPRHSIRMLFAKRVDLLPFNDAVIKDEFESAGYDLNKVTKIMPLFRTPPYFALSLFTSDYILLKLRDSYDELIKSKQISLVD